MTKRNLAGLRRGEKAASSRSKRARPELTRERIIAAALDLIDRQGLPALNMRDLGATLGTSTMSVYRYFKNKGELLDAAVDDIVAQFAPPPQTALGWREQARAASMKVRSAMLAHPALADLIGREFRRSAVSLRVNTEIIDRLREAGVPKALLTETYWAISCYTTGHALLEAQSLQRRTHNARTRKSQEQRQRKLAAMLEQLDEVTPSSVSRAAAVLSRPLDDRQFLFGLDCLLDGIDLRLAAYRHA